MDKELVYTSCSVPKMERNSNSVLDVQVSCFRNYMTPDNPVTINLLSWLASSKYREQVEQIRTTKDKSVRDSLKSKLPAITPSGLFSYRDEKSLVQHNGLMQFDIDLKENRHVGNFYELKQQLGNIPNVAYCGLSVSRQGFWGIIPIASPGKHKEHFEALKTSFLKLGITIDVKPKNVSSLRGYSFDLEPYYNHHALKFMLEEAPPKQKFSYYSQLKFQNSYNSAVKGKVEACIAEIESVGIDITSSYAKWFEIGCSLAAEFGENGRSYFHQVSHYHPKYSYCETEKQYTSCLRGKYNYSIATFFKYCQ